ncbi:MAG: phosphoribosylformylglycinamidine synthase subunit PurS [Anaerolineae bacterium]
MLYRVIVTPAPGVADLRGQGLLGEIASLGIRGVAEVQTADLYFLEGDLDEAAKERLGQELLADPVVQRLQWEALGDEKAAPAEGEPWTVEVALLPGVTDAVAGSLLEGARVLGVDSLTWAATGQRYVLRGGLDKAAVHTIARSLLCNEVIQHYRLGPIVPTRVAREREGPWVETIPLRDLDADALLALSRSRLLSLDGAEMAAIQTYYREQGREPSDIELETLAQTWSEHCVHKTFRALVDYEEYDASGQLVRREQIDGLLRTFIRAATERIAAPWVRSAFVDNAGIVEFDGRHEISFKVETHNHPSALEPFGGANTGVGGVVRDIIGVSARPIANTDVLCFGPQDLPFAELPQGVLHPRRVQSGVVAGIEDYGNKMGIPTVNGAILYHPGYTANPLVYCGCLGIAPIGRHRRQARPGDRVVVVGGRTGRDGLHGATFSSAELTHETGTLAGGAVQIGNPITEKLVLEAVLEARDRGLYTAITDCGAGGLSSAVGEMGQETGVTVHLERVPLKYQGLKPWEIWLSEAQERMVLAVPPEQVQDVLDLCRRWDVEATDIGEFRADGRLVLLYGQELVGELDMAFLHDGLPRRRLAAVWRQVAVKEPELPRVEAGEVLLRLLAEPDIASKEAVIRRYDHEVQGGTAVKPLVGHRDDGPGDATVLVPLDAGAAAALAGVQQATPVQSRAADGSPVTQSALRAAEGAEGLGEGQAPAEWRHQPALALGCGIAPRFGLRDPYAMAWAAADEAIRNVVAVGADPGRIALLDNFCWGSPTRVEQMGALVQAARACHDVALAYGAPFVSGKDSLNNEYGDGRGGRIAIPPTLLISALGYLPDVGRATSMDVKVCGDPIYIVGSTRRELGESYLFRQLGLSGGSVPQPAAEGPALARALHACIRAGWVRAVHDCSEGGLAVAMAEMALAGDAGMHIDLRSVPRERDADDDVVLLFAESNARYVVEVAAEQASAFEQAFAGLPCARVGQVECIPHLEICGLDGQEVVNLPIRALRRAWKGEAL